MRRSIALLLLSMLLVVFSFSPAFAKDVDDSTKTKLNIEMLENLGIDVSSDEPITKGEYAYWVSIIASLDDISIGNISYSDVTSSYKYYKAIEAVTCAKFFTGDGDGKFGKDNKISYDEAIVPLVKLAGYEQVANRNGGFTKGYLYAADEMKLTCSPDKPSELTRNDLACLCATLLESKMYITSLDEEREITEKSDDTVLSYYHDIYKRTGYMNANRYTNLYTEQGYLENSIQIDKEGYIVTDDSFDKYLGYTLDFYYQRLDTGDFKLCAAVPTKDDEVKTVPASSDNVMENNIFTYYDANDKKKTIKIAKGYNEVINNGTNFDPQNNDVMFEEGFLTFIDDNSDGYFETILCRKAESAIIQGIDMYREIIYTSNGEIELNSFDKNKYCKLYRIDEASAVSETTLDYYKKDDVLTVYASENYIEAYAFENKIKGILNQIDEDEVQIDDISYKYLIGSTDNTHLGAQVEVYIDYLGYVVKISEIDEGYKYGYVFSCGYEDSDNTINFKIFTTLGLTEYTTEETIRVNGLKLDAEQLKKLFTGDAMKQVIKYRVRDGKIYVIETQDNLTCLANKKVLRYSPNFPSVGEKYKISDSTLFLIVPTLDDEVSDTSCYGYTYNFKDYPQNYTFSVYDVDDNQKVGAVLMYPSGSRKNDAEPAVNGNVGVIYQVIDAVNDDGEIVKRVKMYTSNNKIETFYTKCDRCTSFSATFGTVVLYVLEGDELIGIKTEFTPDASKPEASKASSMSFTDEWTAYFGKTQKVRNDYFTMSTNYGDDWTSEDNIRIAPLDIQQNIVVNMNDKSITQGSQVNLYPDSYEYVRIFRSQTVRQLVIYQYY